MRSYLIGIAMSAVLSSTVGCAAKPGMHYNVIIDNDSFTDAQKSSVIVAGDAWMTAVPGLSLDYTIANCRGWSRSGVVCVFHDVGSPPSDSRGQVFGHTVIGSDDSAVIHIYDDCIGSKHPYAIADSILHEFGHALGQNANHIPVGVMSATENSNNEEVITSADVEYFWSNR